MKQILIIDKHPLFCEYLKEKLITEKVAVEIISNRRDSFTRMYATLPDLLIYGANESFTETIEFFKKKSQSSNTKLIPTILIGNPIEREKISELALYRIIKYFSRPIKIDVLCETIGRIIGKPIPLDISKCVMEVHVNNNIIFIEIAKGLNREKLMLLKYRIIELLDEYELDSPQIILMMTDLTLSFMDGSNLEVLINNILYDKRIRSKNIKILSFDNFTRKLIAGHSQYNNIEIVSDITDILSTFVREDKSNIHTEDVINEKILSTSIDSLTHGTIQLAFFNDLKDSNMEEELFGGIRIAIIHNNEDTYFSLKKAFKSFLCKVDFFHSSSDFMIATSKIIYDIVVIDLFLEGMTGFDILTYFREKKYPAGVIVYSDNTNQANEIRALSLGAKYFISKEKSSETVAKKVLEILNARI
ncbi:MAG: response regulator [Treponemataceae bacterium]